MNEEEEKRTSPSDMQKVSDMDINGRKCMELEADPTVVIWQTGSIAIL